MTYNYSNIKAIEIQDFRNLGHVKIDFTQSNIICLKGGNEAGKSSVVLALKSLGSMLNTKQYKEYIRTGTDAWTVMVYTMDNKAVYRKKTAKGQSYGIYQICEIDGKEHYELVWSIDKLDENAVPKEVQDILGLTTEPETGELLNIRTYEDKMLFVDTSGGVNYKVMYNALKIDNLSKAIKVGTVEAKNYKGDIDKYTTSIDTCKDEIRKVRLVDIKSLFKIRDRIRKEKDLVENTTQAKSIKHQVEAESSAIKALDDASNLEIISESEFTNLQKVLTLASTLKREKEEVSAINQVFSLEEIDESLKEKCDKAIKLLYEVTHSDRPALVATLSAPIVQDTEIKVLENIEEAIELKSFIQNNDKPELLNTLSIDILDTDTLSKVRKTVGVLKELRNLQTSTLGDVLTLNEIDTEVLSRINKAKELLSSINNMQVQVEQIDKGVQAYYAGLKAANIPYEICPNCGELILPEEGHTHA